MGWRKRPKLVLHMGAFVVVVGGFDAVDDVITVSVVGAEGTGEDITALVVAELLDVAYSSGGVAVVAVKIFLPSS